MEGIDRLAHPGPPLVSHLHEPLVPMGRLHDQLGFVGILAARLLHIDMLARLHRQHRRGCVPEVRRGDEHRVEGFVVEALPKIDHALAVGGLLFLHRLHADGEPLRIDLREIGDVDVGERQKGVDVCHPAAEGDHCHPQSAACRAIGTSHRRGGKARYSCPEAECRGASDG